MDLTRSGAEQRLGPLKRAGVVRSMDVTTGTGGRLTVRVTHLDDSSRQQVEQALADTHWPMNIVQAKAEPSKLGAEKPGP